MIRNLTGLLSGLVLLLLLTGAAAAAGHERLVFLVPDTATGSLAQGIEVFRRDNPGLTERLKITVYSEPELIEGRDKPEFGGGDVIFFYHLNYQVMLGLEEDLRRARAAGAQVMGLGSYQIFARKGFYNVSLDEHPAIDTYWENNGAENVKRLIGYLANRFCGLAEVAVLEPLTQPQQGIFHPDAPGTRIFVSLSEYKAWYASSQHVKKAPWVGILSYNVVKIGDSKVPEAVIRKLEAEGLNVICAIGYPADTLIEDYFMAEEGKVDALISLMFSHPKEKALKLLTGLNLPVIRAVNLYNELAKWETDSRGIEPLQLAPQVFMPELCGLIEPIVVGGKRLHRDEKTGIEVTERVPHAERIARLVGRVQAWVKLRTLSNADKKVALLYYNNPPGKHNIYASYLDVFASMQTLLEGLAVAGYRFTENGNFSKETLQDLILRQGRNIGTWAPGEIEKLVKSGLVTLVPLAAYKSWFAELPESF
ncbi:MAG: cobaltochelatase subunit CobN, partial [Deltaproteobacteria bacterium]|nr:cobaltochelatase subunit CobN [Deltaproteobacteria bacterium]